MLIFGLLEDLCLCFRLLAREHSTTVLSAIGIFWVFCFIQVNYKLASWTLHQATLGADPLWPLAVSFDCGLSFAYIPCLDADQNPIWRRFK